MQRLPVKESVRQNNVPIRFISEFQMNNNSVHDRLTNNDNTFYVTPLSSVNNHCSSSLVVATNYTLFTSESAPRLNLSGQKYQIDNKKTVSYITEKLPEATPSNDIDFDENIPLSKEETRKSVPKEKDADLLVQSYQKDQITATTTGKISSQFVQDTVNPPEPYASLSVNKSHKSLPRRACLVHHKEQYHLDNNLLSQPKATKYLVKVRTEVSPGRFMAKLELQCSR